MAKKKQTEQPQTISKMAAIKRLLAKGLSNPTEIATVEFCEGVGGVDAAKTLLETIERIKKL